MFTFMFYLQINICKCQLILVNHMKLKWALDNFSFIPNIFSKKLRFLYRSLEVYSYVAAACKILQIQLSYRDRCIFLSIAIFKNGCHCHDCQIWHHQLLILVCRNILQLFCAVLWTDTKIA